MKEVMTPKEAVAELKIVRNLMGPSKAREAIDILLSRLEHYEEIVATAQWNADRRKEARENDEKELQRAGTLECSACNNTGWQQNELNSWPCPNCAKERDRLKEQNDDK